VVGGGPAGSTAATAISRMGYRVLLLEREHFPREHVGESLLPASLPIFEDLGVRDEIEAAGFLKKTGAVMVWGRDRQPWSWHFAETNPRYPYAFQVWRPQFDQILLTNSARHGVDVRQGCRVLDVLRDGERATGVRYMDDHGRESVVRAAMIVDASGQTGLIGRALELRRADPFFRNLAVYGYFSGATPLAAPDAGNIFIESYEHGWCWGIPLHTNRLSVGIVVDSRYGAELRQGDGVAAFYKAQIAQAQHMAERLRDAELVEGPIVVRDWSYLSNDVAGDGWVLAGDAACFVDPLFSSGVHLALTSGMLAAAYAVTALRRPELRAASADVYKGLYYRQYGLFRELAKLFYATNRSIDSYFWETRRLLGGDDSITPREAFIQAVAGQPVQGYERAVIDRGEAPAEFVEGVRALEQERSERGRRLASVVQTDGAAALARLTPKLAEGAQVVSRPVLGDGEFVPGIVLTTPERVEGVPVSRLLARALALVDGQRSIAALLDQLKRELPAEQSERIDASLLLALQTLYADGCIAEIAGL
jgi:flavin-dependent dehydrogenase